MTRPARNKQEMIRKKDGCQTEPCGLQDVPISQHSSTRTAQLMEKILDLKNMEGASQQL